MSASGEALPDAQDTSYHRRRLEECLRDPEFLAAYERAAREIAEVDAAVQGTRTLDRTGLAARVADLRDRVADAGLDVSVVDEAIAAAREDALAEVHGMFSAPAGVVARLVAWRRDEDEREIAESYRRGYTDHPQEDWIGAAGLELFGAAVAAERRAELIECLEYLVTSLAALQAREDVGQTVPWDDLRGILSGRAGSVANLLAWRREEAAREDAEETSH